MALPRREQDTGRASWILAVVGCLGAATAIAVHPDAARAAAAQDWPPFVLVSGLLLVGLVAEEDGLFAAARRVRTPGTERVPSLRRSSRPGRSRDDRAEPGHVSSVLTPVLVYTARQRGQGEVALLYACLLLSNAGSLLLPGSNLTNLIVLGHLHLSGADFFRHMAPAWLASVVVTALVIGVAERHSLRASINVGAKLQRPVLGIGLIAVLAVTVLVLVLHSPALPVAAVGLASVSLRAPSRTEQGEQALDVLGVPVLIGLFGIAVALGTLGRVWSGPTALLSHLDIWGTAVVAAGASVLVNNLPAASLLAARTPPHPFALLVGLNIGPNLFVTGSLAWLLWLRAARSAGAEPSVAKASRLGVIAVPLAMAAALGMLTIGG